jgi:hypothetical protein
MRVFKSLPDLQTSQQFHQSNPATTFKHRNSPSDICSSAIYTNKFSIIFPSDRLSRNIRPHFMAEEYLPHSVIQSIHADQPNRSQFWKYEHSLRGDAVYLGIKKRLKFSFRQIKSSMLIFRLFHKGHFPPFVKGTVQGEIPYCEGDESKDKKILTSVWYQGEYCTFNKSEPLYLERTAQFKIFVLWTHWMCAALNQAYPPLLSCYCAFSYPERFIRICKAQSEIFMPSKLTILQRLGTFAPFYLEQTRLQLFYGLTQYFDRPKISNWAVRSKYNGSL